MKWATVQSHGLSGSGSMNYEQSEKSQQGFLLW